MPVVEDHLAASEGEARAALLHAEEASDEVESGGADVACEIRKQTEEEAGSTVQQNDFRTVIEVWIFGNGLLVALAHESDHLRKAEVAADSFVHHVEEGGVDGEVIGLV